ncbi:hypothetical protein MMC25_007209 [Agyrium rufum]|nr:hypothetical protein [Agyrium rufum]
MEASDHHMHIPKTPAERDVYKHDFMHGKIGKIIALFKDGRKPTTPASEDLELLTQFLDYLYEYIEMTPEVAQDIGIKPILQVMMGEKNTGQLCNLPEPFPHKAKTVYNRFESQNWGKKADDDDTKIKVENLDPSGLGSSSIRFYDESRVLDSIIVNTTPLTHRTRKVVGPPKRRFLAAPEDHPIYGKNGLMRGIIASRRTNQVSYRLDPTYRDK